jgi:hypothetical protein
MSRDYVQVDAKTWLEHYKGLLVGSCPGCGKPTQISGVARIDCITVLHQDGEVLAEDPGASDYPRPIHEDKVVTFCVTGESCPDPWCRGMINFDWPQDRNVCVSEPIVRRTCSDYLSPVWREEFFTLKIPGGWTKVEKGD